MTAVICFHAGHKQVSEQGNTGRCPGGSEEVYLWEYETFEEAHKNIKKFIELVYNKKRVHSSLGYITPEEFEMSEEVLNRKVS